MMRLLLDNGEDPQFGRGRPNCYLLEMCAGNFWVYTEMLINAGTDINIRDPNGHTALFWAANCDHDELIHLLLDKGADINTKLDPHMGGHTPLHGAAIYNRFDAARILIMRGADVSLTDAEGLTALQLAESYGSSHEGIVSVMKGAIEEMNAK